MLTIALVLWLPLALLTGHIFGRAADLMDSVDE